jgi:hypothetical protein
MLNDEQSQKIRLVLQSSGWNDVIRPAIENRGRSAVKALTLSRSERAEQFKNTDFDTEDDVLRAIIRDCNWMVVCWYNELNVYDHNRKLDELERQESNAGTAAANP